MPYSRQQDRISSPAAKGAAIVVSISQPATILKRGLSAGETAICLPHLPIPIMPILIIAHYPVWRHRISLDCDRLFLFALFVDDAIDVGYFEVTARKSFGMAQQLTHRAEKLANLPRIHQAMVGPQDRGITFTETN